LKPDGYIDPDVTDEDAKSGSYETFFTETSNGKYVPRSIFVDLDPSVRDESNISIGGKTADCGPGSPSTRSGQAPTVSYFIQSS
jgi:hypothetical protein